MSELPGLGGSDRPVHRIGGADLCALLGITHGALSGLVKRELAVKLGHDSYDLGATVAAYVAHLRGTASGRGGEEQIVSLTAERARLARAQAESAEIKNAALRRELVPAAEVAREWGEALRAVRSRLLAVPSRVQAALPHLAASDMVTLDRELRSALEDLAQADGGDDAA